MHASHLTCIWHQLLQSPHFLIDPVSTFLHQYESSITRNDIIVLHQSNNAMVVQNSFSLGKIFRNACYLPSLTDCEQQQLGFAVWSGTCLFPLLLFPFLDPPDFPVQVQREDLRFS